MNDLDNAMPASQDGDHYQPQWGTWTRQLAIVVSLIAVVYALTLLARHELTLYDIFAFSGRVFAKPSHSAPTEWTLPNTSSGEAQPPVWAERLPAEYSRQWCLNYRGQPAVLECIEGGEIHQVVVRR